MNPDANGWYRVHANDGSGLDYSTTLYDPERHDLVDAPASDEHGRPHPAAAAVVAEELPEPEKAPEPEKPKTADKASVNKPEEATK
jgi:hypothetical protein